MMKESLESGTREQYFSRVNASLCLRFDLSKGGGRKLLAVSRMRCLNLQRLLLRHLILGMEIIYNV